MAHDTAPPRRRCFDIRWILKMSTCGQLSLLAAVVSLFSYGMIFMDIFYRGGICMFFLLGPLMWIAAMLTGAIAVVNEDRSGYLGLSLGYISFLLSVSRIFFN